MSIASLGISSGLISSATGSSPLSSSSYDYRSKQRSVKSSAVIIDIGTQFTRAGFAGEAYPRIILKNNFDSILPAVQLTPDRVSFSNTINPLSVRTWQRILNRFIRLLYSNYLQINPKDRRIMILEQPFIHNNYKQALFNVIYELEVPGILLLPALTLPNYCQLSSGSYLNSLNIDCGYREIRIIAICEGCALNHTILSIPIGFPDIFLKLKQLLLIQNRDKDAAIQAEKEAALNSTVLADIIARCCYIKPLKDSNPTAVLVQPAYYNSPPTKSSAGRIEWLIPATARTMPFDQLFHNNNRDYSHNVGSLVAECLLRCTPAIRPQIMQNIIVTGGLAIIPGFLHRLAEEINLSLGSPRYPQQLSPLVNKFRFGKLLAAANLAQFTGASVVGGMELSDEEFMNRDEIGAYCVGRKIPVKVSNPAPISPEKPEHKASEEELTTPSKENNANNSLISPRSAATVQNTVYIHKTFEIPDWSVPIISRAAIYPVNSGLGGNLSPLTSPAGPNKPNFKYTTMRRNSILQNISSPKTSQPSPRSSLTGIGLPPVLSSATNSPQYKAAIQTIQEK
jgi:actin-related protein 10